jgi:hypothetical protein
MLDRVAGAETMSRVTCGHPQATRPRIRTWFLAAWCFSLDATLAKAMAAETGKRDAKPESYFFFESSLT